MCGIVGIVSNSPVNQTLYDALLLLQHRGQDAAGIATSHDGFARRHHQPQRALRQQLRDQFHQRGRRDDPPRRRGIARPLTGVVSHHVMSVTHQPLRHVGAHAAKTDHAQFHSAASVV